MVEHHSGFWLKLVEEEDTDFRKLNQTKKIQDSDLMKVQRLNSAAFSLSYVSCYQCQSQAKGRQVHHEYLSMKVNDASKGFLMFLLVFLSDYQLLQIDLKLFLSIF